MDRRDPDAQTPLDSRVTWSATTHAPATPAPATPTPATPAATSPAGIAVAVDKVERAHAAAQAAKA